MDLVKELSENRSLNMSKTLRTNVRSVFLCMLGNRNYLKLIFTISDMSKNRGWHDEIAIQ